MNYRGMYNLVNARPEGEWVEIFVSDWNKDFWAFYAYIAKDNYEADIKAINDLLTRMNWRDGDVYVELINHSDGLEDFYMKLYEGRAYTHMNVLYVENWQESAPA